MSLDQYVATRIVVEKQLSHLKEIVQKLNEAGVAITNKPGHTFFEGLDRTVSAQDQQQSGNTIIADPDMISPDTITLRLIELRKNVDILRVNWGLLNVEQQGQLRSPEEILKNY